MEIENKWRTITRNVLNKNNPPAPNNLALFKEQVQNMILNEVGKDAVNNFYDDIDITYNAIRDEAIEWLCDKELY